MSGIACRASLPVRFSDAEALHYRLPEGYCPALRQFRARTNRSIDGFLLYPTSARSATECKDLLAIPVSPYPFRHFANHPNHAVHLLAFCREREAAGESQLRIAAVEHRLAQGPQARLRGEGLLLAVEHDPQRLAEIDRAAVEIESELLDLPGRDVDAVVLNLRLDALPLAGSVTDSQKKLAINGSVKSQVRWRGTGLRVKANMSLILSRSGRPPWPKPFFNSISTGNAPLFAALELLDFLVERLAALRAGHRRYPSRRP